MYFESRRFLGLADFSYTTFEGGGDFGNASFESEVYLNNAIIKNIASFCNVEFKGKVNGWDLNCNDGVDFRWANFRGKVNLSHMKVKNDCANFHKANFENNGYFYGSEINKIVLRKSVIEKGLFFLDSKIATADRETWRIIKNEYIKQNNRIEALKFHSREMAEYERELVSKHDNVSDRFILFFNRISNGHNLKPARGVVFTFIATFFTYLLFICVLAEENDLKYIYSIKYLGVNLKQLLIVLNVTKWDFKPFDYEFNWAYPILFLGRVVIGYGIYQTVQAFRKFGKL